MIPNLSNSTKDVKHLLQYNKEYDLKEMYPNDYIVIRLLLTIPVSTASAERIFSKLKLIKTHLRNTKGQETLSALAVLSVVADIPSKINYQPIIKEFNKSESRKCLYL